MTGEQGGLPPKGILKLIGSDEPMGGFGAEAKPPVIIRVAKNKNDIYHNIRQLPHAIFNQS